MTGGASGIGAAICDAFAAKGARVAVVDLNAAAAEAKAKAIGGGAAAYACDVSDPASVQKAVDSVLAAFGGVDILVNSAGVAFLAPADRTAARLLGQDDRHQSERHVSHVAGRRQGDDRRRPRRQDRQPRFASRHRRHRQHVAYCASKFGVIGLSKVLAAEWGKHGICVNTISPTVVLTELGKKAWDNPKGDALKAAHSVGPLRSSGGDRRRRGVSGLQRRRHDQRRGSARRRRLYDCLKAASDRKGHGSSA